MLFLPRPGFYSPHSGSLKWSSIEVLPTAGLVRESVRMVRLQANVQHLRWIYHPSLLVLQQLPGPHIAMQRAVLVEELVEEVKSVSLTVRCRYRATPGKSDKHECLDVVKGILIVHAVEALLGMMESWSVAD